MKRRGFTFPVPTHHQAMAGALMMVGAIAIVDWFIIPNASYGLLYFFPMFFAATFLAPREIVAFALASAMLKEHFSNDAWSGEVLPRFLFSFAAYSGMALYRRERERGWQFGMIRDSLVTDQIRQRDTVLQQFRSFVEGSPAAILTVDSDGRVIIANEAAHQMLRCESRTLPGQLIDEFLPTIATLRQARISRRIVRTSIECTGYRRGGEVFLAQTWVSSLGSADGGGMSVIVFDSSEELRSREEGKLQNLTASARVVLGSFWHETRNICTALRVTAQSLKQIPGVVDSEEIVVLISLIAGLEKLAASEMSPESDRSHDCASLRSVLDHLRIVIEPSFKDAGIALTWKFDSDMPLVRGDQHAILQVFLNLARNAACALEGLAADRRMTIEAFGQADKVLVRFRNNGPAIVNPDDLFKPFQAQATGRGMGLYVSRALIRSFGGDLRYEPSSKETSFLVVMERGGTWLLVNSPTQRVLAR